MDPSVTAAARAAAVVAAAADEKAVAPAGSVGGGGAKAQVVPAAVVVDAAATNEAAATAAAVAAAAAAAAAAEAMPPTTTCSTMGQHGKSPVVSVRVVPGKGRGVFAAQAIPRGAVVEHAPCIAFPPTQYEEHLKHTELEHYLFLAYDEEEDPLNTKPRVSKFLLALGLGSLFNHSKNNNVGYVINSASDSITYTTTREVAAGDELCIFYGHDLWFKPVGEGEESAGDSSW